MATEEEKTANGAKRELENAEEAEGVSKKGKSEEDPEAKESTPETKTTEELTADELKDTFSSLKDPMASTSPLLALYFASSWCPDCTGVTPVVNDVFLKSQPQEDGKVFDLVYVSSDDNEEQLKKYVPSPKWGIVPFDNVEERSNLKRHFGACASKETSVLGMKPEDRKSGIPTLILLDSKTGKVVTRDGVDDILGEGGGEAAVKKWQESV